MFHGHVPECDVIGTNIWGESSELVTSSNRVHTLKYDVTREGEGATLYFSIVPIYFIFSAYFFIFSEYFLIFSTYFFISPTYFFILLSFIDLFFTYLRNMKEFEPENITGIDRGLGKIPISPASVGGGCHKF